MCYLSKRISKENKFNRDGQDGQDEGKRKKAKGKSVRKKSKVVSASLVPFSFCPLPFFSPVHPVYPC
jgi:hypothetical protein